MWFAEKIELSNKLIFGFYIPRIIFQPCPKYARPHAHLCWVVAHVSLFFEGLISYFAFGFTFVFSLILLLVFILFFLLILFLISIFIINFFFMNYLPLLFSFAFFYILLEIKNIIFSLTCVLSSYNVETILLFANMYFSVLIDGLIRINNFNV